MLWDDFDGSIGAQGFRETPSLKASPLLSDAGAIRLMAFSLLGCRIKHCSSSSPPAHQNDLRFWAAHITLHSAFASFSLRR
jgi:hypothetical protein